MDHCKYVLGKGQATMLQVCARQKSDKYVDSTLLLRLQSIHTGGQLDCLLWKDTSYLLSAEGTTQGDPLSMRPMQEVWYP